MEVDPTVIAAVERALDDTPNNLALRLHLAELLLRGDRPAESLGHIAVILAADPVNTSALSLGTIAAMEIGDEPKAKAYEAIFNGLTGASDMSDEVDEDALNGPLLEGSIDSLTESDIDKFLAEVLSADTNDTVKLSDVGGLDDVKQRLEASFLGPMRNATLTAAYGQSLRGGLLLYGPPGCGKTFLARAIAGELGARFFSIGLNDVLDMWLGQSEQKLHMIFETARKNAPCVLFFDELDALGFNRSNMSQSVGRNVVVQLLSELDSIGNNNEGVFVLGATNRPWDVDAALRRPGRFDRTILVLPPDDAARRVIAEYHLRKRPVGDLDLGRVAKLTDGYSGADIALLCRSASEYAMQDAMVANAVVPITNKHFDLAQRSITPSVRSWFDTAENFAMFANSSGEYDDLLGYIKRKKSSRKFGFRQRSDE